MLLACEKIGPIDVLSICLPLKKLFVLPVFFQRLPGSANSDYVYHFCCTLVSDVHGYLMNAVQVVADDHGMPQVDIWKQEKSFAEA